MVNKYTPFKRFCIQNFPYIEADFDAITNYELLCLIVEYLNRVIDSQNYIINWFNNLDITDEVNKKLDEMAEDGTLADIINNKLFSTINNKAISSAYNSSVYNLPYDKDVVNKVDYADMTSNDFYNLWDDLQDNYPHKIKSFTYGYDDFGNELKYYIVNANDKIDCGKNNAGIYYSDDLNNDRRTSNNMFFMSGVHGNEKVSIYMLYIAFKDFLEGKKQSDNFILDNYTYIVLPCCNPSGINANTRNNGNNVNINRNFPTDLWNTQTATDKGNSAGSEKETQFIINVFNNYNDNYNKIGMVCVDFHAFDYSDNEEHPDKNILWYSSNSYKLKNILFKTAESIKDMILEKYPTLKVDPTDETKRLIRVTSGGVNSNTTWYFYKKGFKSLTLEVPQFIHSMEERYSVDSNKISYIIIANTILQLTLLSNNNPDRVINRLAEIGSSTSDSLNDVIDKVPNGSILSVVIASDSTLMDDIPHAYNGDIIAGLLTITKSNIEGSNNAILSYDSIGLTHPKKWLSSKDSSGLKSWNLLKSDVYGRVSEIPNISDNPTLSEICEKMDDGTIAILRIGSSNSQLYNDCMSKLGILTIKKPAYSNVDCEIEFVEVGSNFEKYYNIYFRGELRGFRKCNLTSI